MGKSDLIFCHLSLVLKEFFGVITTETFVCLWIGYLLGGHVMRLFHGHDESLTIPGSDQSEEQQR